MKRSVVLLVAVASLVAAAAAVWVEVRREREYRRLIAEGQAALGSDQTFVAIETFSGALALKPDSMLAHLKRGDTYRRRGDLAAALRDLTQAARLDPTAPQPLELLGDVNAAMGRHDVAADHYLNYVALDDRAPRVLYKLALARYRQGQVSDALERLRKAIEIEERYPEAHYLLGICLRAQNRRDDAVVALTRAVTLNPSFTAARAELADVYLQLGRSRPAIEQLEALSRLEPDRAERLVSVGLAYARLGQPDSAIVALGRAADRHPESAAVYTALGRVWLDVSESRGDPVALGKALEALQPGASSPSATSETLALYGRALLLSGNAAGAERALQQAVTRFPVEPLAFRYLADAAARLGHLGVARDAEKRYAALGGTS